MIKLIKTKVEYVKSCLNYTGGKYRLLNQIIPLFPNTINNFTDLFCGGANVTLNVNSNGIIRGIDNQEKVLSLFNTLKKSNEQKVLQIVNDIILDYNLSESKKYGYTKYGCDSGSGLADYNRENYLKLREDYNNRLKDNIYFDLSFYLLTVYGFNNQIRFNRKGHFNIPVGKRDFNERVKDNLVKFMNAIKEKNIDFVCADFRDIELEMSKGDFLYADPPYLISTATYNEQNGWTEREEKDLLNLLDSLNKKGVKFAVSNVLEHKGEENAILKAWAKNYNIHYLNYNYRNSNYQIKQKSAKTREVLITNY